MGEWIHHIDTYVKDMLYADMPVLVMMVVMMIDVVLRQ